MIIYYSATGNCKYVANRIASKTRDIAKSMIGYNDSVYLEKDESLGIVVLFTFGASPHLLKGFYQRLI